MKTGQPENRSVADLLGPWVEPGWESGLVDRCRQAWSKPISQLSDEELATFLRQRIAPEHILPLAEARLRAGVSDETEKYDGELQEAVEYAKRNI